MAEKPENNKINESCDYLVINYIEENSTLPPSIWATGRSSRSLTTYLLTACESFHSEFNSNLYYHHPSIFKKIEVLKIFEQIHTFK